MRTAAVLAAASLLLAACSPAVQHAPSRAPSYQHARLASIYITDTLISTEVVNISPAAYAGPVTIVLAAAPAPSFLTYEHLVLQPNEPVRAALPRPPRGQARLILYTGTIIADEVPLAVP